MSKFNCICYKIVIRVEYTFNMQLWMNSTASASEPQNNWEKQKISCMQRHIFLCFNQTGRKAYFISPKVPCIPGKRLQRIITASLWHFSLQDREHEWACLVQGSQQVTRVKSSFWDNTDLWNDSIRYYSASLSSLSTKGILITHHNGAKNKKLNYKQSSYKL